MIHLLIREMAIEKFLFLGILLFFKKHLINLFIVVLVLPC